MSETSPRKAGAPRAVGPVRSGAGEQDRADSQRPVGWGFVLLYALAYIGTILLFLAPLLVSLSLKVNALVGTDRAPDSLSLVAGTGAFLAMFANPFFGKMSDRTASPRGMRRPWMVTGLLGGSVGILVVALAPNIGGVLVGWCIAPCAIGGFFILLFAATLTDRRLAAADRPVWSLREFASTFYVNPRRNRDFAWAFASRFMFVLAYAFLTTYQVYYLLEQLNSAEDDVPRQLFLATLTMSSVVVMASLVGGWLSDRAGRRKVFVGAASVVFGLAMFVIALSTSFNGFVAGMALGGLGFGLYLAVDLALVVDVLPDPGSAAKDLGVMNIAGALPSSVAPALTPAILAVGSGSYGVLYAVAGVCAIIGAGAIMRVQRVR